jgi:hypothetical protein
MRTPHVALLAALPRPGTQKGAYMSEDLKAILQGYELRIQQMMLDLDEKLQVFGVRIDHVEIDASTFATKIHTKEVVE